mgnify:FL=1
MLFLVSLSVLGAVLVYAEYRERKRWNRFSAELLRELDELGEQFDASIDRAKATNERLAAQIAANERELAQYD